MYVTVTKKPPSEDESRVIVCVPMSGLCRDCPSWTPPFVESSYQTNIDSEGVPQRRKEEMCLDYNVTKHPPICPHCGDEICAGDIYYVFNKDGTMCESCIGMYEHTAE